MDTQQDINFMKYSGILVGTRSYNNMSLDLLRSGLTKYIMVNNFDKAIWCAIELFLFHRLNINSVRTNLVNKLFLIYVNHLCLSNIYLIVHFDYMLNIIETYPDSRIKLCETIKSLCSCKQNNKIHVYSTIFNYLVTKNNKTQSDVIKFELEMQDISDISDYNLGDYWLHRETKDPDELVNYMDYLIYYIDQNSIKSIYWLYRINYLTKNKVKAAKRLRRFKPIYAVWEHLFERAKNENSDKFPIIENLNICYKYYIKINENINILLMALMLFLDDYDFSEKIEHSVFSKQQVDEYYDVNLNKQIIEIDDFCFDKNVKEGRHLLDYQKPTTYTDKKIFDFNGINEKFLDLYSSCKIQFKEKKKKKRKKTITVTIELEEDVIPGTHTFENEEISDITKDIINYMKT